jgi:holo-[acyl-carrier protein] synthase
VAIIGLGTDIVEIARITAQLQHSDRLAQRVLRPNELLFFQQHNYADRYLAKRFAAKEAAVKALGIGIGNGVSFQDVEVENLAGGQPILHFFGRFAQLCAERGVTHSFISISDEQHYAVATVVLEAN